MTREITTVKQEATLLSEQMQLVKEDITRVCMPCILQSHIRCYLFAIIGAPSSVTVISMLTQKHASFVKVFSFDGRVFIAVQGFIHYLECHL